MASSRPLARERLDVDPSSATIPDQRGGLEGLAEECVTHAATVDLTANQLHLHSDLTLNTAMGDRVPWGEGYPTATGYRRMANFRIDCHLKQALQWDRSIKPMRRAGPRHPLRTLLVITRRKSDRQTLWLSPTSVPMAAPCPATNAPRNTAAATRRGRRTRREEHTCFQCT